MNYLGEHWCIDLPSLFLDVIRQNYDREIRAGGGGVEKLCGCMAWFQSVWLHAAGEQKNRFTFLHQQGHLFEAVFGTNLFIMWNGFKAAAFSGQGQRESL